MLEEKRGQGEGKKTSRPEGHGVLRNGGNRNLCVSLRVMAETVGWVSSFSAYLERFIHLVIATWSTYIFVCFFQFPFLSYNVKKNIANHLRAVLGKTIFKKSKKLERDG